MRSPEALPVAELDRSTEGLKKFQLDTVAAVVEAMFERGQRRFLVADEVGLGKTKIARATVAETIRRLWNDGSVDRIDVIYICSNSQIARQNLMDLEVVAPTKRPAKEQGAGARSVRTADRLTMLPTILANLGDVNVVAFTPGTSFQVGDNAGRVGERAMLWKLLAHEAVGWAGLLGCDCAREIFRGRASRARFEAELGDLDDFEPPRAVVAGFGKHIRAARLMEEFADISDGRRADDADRGRRLIARLRRLLAETCIDHLSPDLVILDEFQRFSHLLAGEGEDGELAKLLLEQPTARVLLLSATPYKMLTNAEDDESHFEGFERTVAFLLGDGREQDLQTLRRSLGELRAGILGHRDTGRLAAARDRAQSVLRSVMVRTERLAATADRDGMLDIGSPATCNVTAADVDSFVAVDKAAQVLADVPSMIEYWKSAPYLFNFMDDYIAKRRVRQSLAASSELQQALRGDHMLAYEDIDRYRPLDPRNGRLRWLLDELNAASAFDVLWIPPAMPQTRLAGNYAKASALTKRLVFSSWSVVPKSVAALTSYEFERRHGRIPTGQTERPSYQRRKASRPFGFKGSASDNFSGWFALLLPCKFLVDIGDPLAVARATGATLPLSLTELREHAKSAIAARLQPLLTGPDSGAGRSIWYSAAQVWLDKDLVNLTPEDWIGDQIPPVGGEVRSNGDEGRSHDDEDDDAARSNDDKARSRAFREHWKRLVEAHGSPESWGPRPADLVDRLADLAIAGPAVATLRALMRQRGRFDADLGVADFRKCTASIAWAFISFFNAPEAHAMIEASVRDDRLDYWQQILVHCADGGLGSALDEWFHLVPDQCRLNRSSDKPLEAISKLAANVLRLEGGRSNSDFYDRIDASGQQSRSIRSHFAMRYGQARGITAEGENPTGVRNAFNSPFRPFVLVSTSVGQEGLDFHYYAHAVVHWNLPNNPVDLEQREGRVHRYKNHAVRKNMAADFGNDARLATATDPWDGLFTWAAEQDDGDGGLRPHWVYDGDAHIKRLVPLLPLSREVGKLRQLVEATSLYRMTIGQPRQAELMEVLAGLGKEEQDALRAAVSIDLKPRKG